jgi:hypothetical protein
MITGCSTGPPAPPSETVTVMTERPVAALPAPTIAPAPSAPAPVPGVPVATAAPAAQSWTMPNLIARNLQDAQDAIQALTNNEFFYSGSTDLTGKGRNQIMDESKIDVVVRVCQPGLAGDPLKDVATTIASAIKGSPVGDTVESLRVTNIAEDGNPEGRVRAEGFQMYLWSPDAVCCVNRAGWKYPSEK